MVRGNGTVKECTELWLKRKGSKMSDEIRFTEADEYITRGAALCDREKYEDALEMFKRAEALEPKKVNVYLKEGEALVMLDRYEEAKKAFQKAILLDKTNGLAYFHLGNTEFLLDEPDAGREMYAKAINAGFINYQIYFNLGTYYEQQGDFEEAVKNYNKAISRDPLKPEAKLRKSEIYIATGNFKNAIQALDELIKTNPDTFEGYHYKFMVYVRMNDWYHAAETIEKALKLFPDDPGFIFDNILLYEKQERFDEALEIIDKQLEGGYNRDSIKEKAKIFIALGRKNEGIALFEEVRAKEKNDDEACFFLMGIYLSEKDYKKCMECAEDIIKIGPISNFFFNAVYFRAEAASGLKGETDIEMYKEAEEVFRNVSTAYAEREDLFIYRAFCYNKLGNYERAIEMARYVLMLNEESSEAHAVLAETYRLTGDTARAEEEERLAKQLSVLNRAAGEES